MRSKSAGLLQMQDIDPSLHIPAWTSYNPKRRVGYRASCTSLGDLLGNSADLLPSLPPSPDPSRAAQFPKDASPPQRLLSISNIKTCAMYRR